MSKVTAAIFAFSLCACTRERTSVWVVPAGDEGTYKKIGLSEQGAVVAHAITFVKGKYNVLEWDPCRRIESVKIHDEGVGTPEVIVEYSDKDCTR